MDMTYIKEKAKQLGIQTGRMKKTDLIRAIQSKEGNSPCFETAKEYCNQVSCSWRKGCIPSEKLGKKVKQTQKLYLKKIQTEMDELADTLAALKKKTEKAMGEGKKEALAEIHTLEKLSKELGKKARELAATGEDAWETAKQGIDKAWDELRGAAKKTLRKFS